MNKGLKITLITLGSILGVIVVLIGGFFIYLSCSPNFVVWMLRQNFGGETQIINPDNYEQIRTKVNIYKDLEYPSADGRNKYDIYLPDDVEGVCLQLFGCMAALLLQEARTVLKIMP